MSRLAAPARVSARALSVGPGSARGGTRPARAVDLRGPPDADGAGRADRLHAHRVADRVTPLQVKDILQRTATPLPSYATWEVGAGYLDAYAAVTQAFKTPAR